MTQVNESRRRRGTGKKPVENGGGTKKTLVITWQRLVFDGDTCPRCGRTEGELDKAVVRLSKKLGPAGINVVLKKVELSLAQFKKNPIKSNRILFNGRSLEDISGAGTGQSQCCGACGDKKCRTVLIRGKSHEIVPAEIIIQAGLVAAAEL